MRISIGPIVAAAGEVGFVAGKSLQMWRPGDGMRNPGHLDDEIPHEPWRITIAGGSVFCVGREAAYSLPMGSGKRGKRVGMYVAQGALDTLWLGIRREEDTLFAELVSGEGDLVALHEIGEVEEGVLQPVSNGETALLVSDRGRVWEMGHGYLGSLGLDQVMYATMLEGQVLAVGRKSGSIHVASMTVGGILGVSHPISGLIDVACPPMVAGGKLVLVGRQPDRVFTIEPLTLRVEAEPSHGFMNVESALMLETSQGPFAVLVGADHNQKCVSLVNTQTGYVPGRILSAGSKASVNIIAADGMLFVAQSQQEESRISAYKL
ncbi:MAG: hypothetical protein ACAH95_08920 [Fimbriimonas sp.]